MADLSKSSAVKTFVGNANVLFDAPVILREDGKLIPLSELPEIKNRKSDVSKPNFQKTTRRAFIFFTFLLAYLTFVKICLKVLLS